MAKHKETPRQRLIGMMYLVLTAMLALNVSKEVLEGYNAVNETFVSSNKSFTEKQKIAFDNFLKELTLNKVEVKPFWDKAKTASRYSSEMIAYIVSLRDELVARTENIPLDSARHLQMKDMRKKDNYTIPTEILIGPLENASKGKARELKNKLKAYKEKLLGMVNPATRKNVQIGLETDVKFKDRNGNSESWEHHYFYDIPLAADITILNKFITEINDAEIEIVNALLRESIAEDFKYDKIEAKVLPQSNYLFGGDEYQAEVIVAAYDTSHTPTPSVYLMPGVDSLLPNQRDKAMKISSDHGRLKFKMPTNTLGEHKYAGFVSVPTASGKERTYHFKGQYFVSQPNLTVSPTYMNVLYIGVENPLSISVTGIPKENLQPSITDGSIKPGQNGDWIATVRPGIKETTVNASLKTAEGIKQVGSFKFRVKKLPDPTPTIAGHNIGFVSREAILDAGKIIAVMPADFEFNFRFRVLSFKMQMQRGFNLYTYDSKDENLTDEMLEQISKTNRGQILEFKDIIVNGPANEKRELPNFSITIR